MNYVPNIGNLCNSEAKRDAIHIAVTPVVAAYELAPGARVGLIEGGLAGNSWDPIGIVDPFLKEPVKKGENFWMFLFPNSVTNLRHTWQHPAFKVTIPNI